MKFNMCITYRIKTKHPHEQEMDEGHGAVVEGSVLRYRSDIAVARGNQQPTSILAATIEPKNM